MHQEFARGGSPLLPCRPARATGPAGAPAPKVLTVLGGVGR